MEKAKIIFSNGTEIEAEVNGSCFITATKPSFHSDLTTVIVKSNDDEKELRNVVVNEAASVDGRYWFALRELSAQEMKDIKIQADIDYIAMMTDTEL